LPPSSKDDEPLLTAFLAALRGRARGLCARGFPGRFRVAGIVLATFLLVSLATRLGLAVFNADWSVAAPWRLGAILLTGALYDLAAGLWWALPFALVAWLWPDSPRGARALALLALVATGATFFALAFIAGAEFVFWNEFATRFNFIAVDYLVYTREVIGNIRESYAVGPIVAGVGAAALGMLALVWRPIVRAARPAGMGFARRAAHFGALAALAVALFGLLDERPKELLGDTTAAQLAGNGPWEFGHAFRTNEIDYTQFYATVAIDQAYRTLREEFEHAAPARFTGNAALPIERDVVAAAPMRRLNVVLISVESLSADFLGAFGNRQGITPNLDALAGESLFFTELYATGTRTVRGLEALTLSLPPTPGQSVIKRPHNEHLFTLGEVFAENGYESLFLYGGYGYFDNMSHFFANNGYTVVDRTALAAEDIHYENIWGVADEDLFTLALRELDRRHAAGTPFFAHVMTTSNHRPFTYPAGRIDIPSGTSREGAVKYTDWAIGDFLRRAREKPWFARTVFVVVADHCAASRGRTDLPIERFHIPLLVYSPGNVIPGRVATVASQIDVGPTLLGLLGFSYRSRFFGQDILTDGRVHQRALLANYQTVGYLEDGVLVELRPKRRVRAVDPATGRELPGDARSRHLIEEAIGYYQAASDAFDRGGLRSEPSGDSHRHSSTSAASSRFATARSHASDSNGRPSL